MQHTHVFVNGRLVHTHAMMTNNGDVTALWSFSLCKGQCFDLFASLVTNFAFYPHLLFVVIEQPTHAVSQPVQFVASDNRTSAVCCCSLLSTCRKNKKNKKVKLRDLPKHTHRESSLFSRTSTFLTLRATPPGSQKIYFYQSYQK